MKFLVDEMPYRETDCPFFDIPYRTCKCGLYANEHCAYYDDPARERRAENCPHLKALDTAEKLIMEIDIDPALMKSAPDAIEKCNSKRAL